MNNFPYELELKFDNFDENIIFVDYILNNFEKDIDYKISPFRERYCTDLKHTLLSSYYLFFKNEEDVLMLKLKFGL